MSDKEQAWPALPFVEWKDTCATLHMWTQIVGKVRLAQSPLINHWWEVPLYVSARGLTTSSIPCPTGSFEISFDFIDHRLDIKTSRRRISRDRALPSHGGWILSRVHGDAALAGTRYKDLADAGGNTESDTVRPGRYSCPI